MNSKASTGTGWRWTARSPKRRWPGKKTGANPTDRGKRGVKRSLLTEGSGIPVGLAVDGANRHDMKLVGATLESLPVAWPAWAEGREQHLCLDAGYDYDEVRSIAEEFGLVAHIRSRGAEKQELAREAHKRARRWVVERSHSWLNRFRGVLVRWEKKAGNYVALLHLVFGYIAFRQSGLLG